MIDSWAGCSTPDQALNERMAPQTNAVFTLGPS